MQKQTVAVYAIDNGFLVFLYQPSGDPTQFYCPDQNSVAQYLVEQMLPGATFTPAPAANTSANTANTGP